MSKIIGITASTPLNPNSVPGGDTSNLEKRVSDIERDHPSNTIFVEGMKALAENPENEGKYYGVKDEMVTLLDAPTGGANIITVNSEAELPDPTTVPKNTIALVPSVPSDSGNGLQVFSMTSAWDGQTSPFDLNETDCTRLTELLNEGKPIIVDITLGNGACFRVFASLEATGSIMFVGYTSVGVAKLMTLNGVDWSLLLSQ